MVSIKRARFRIASIHETQRGIMHVLFMHTGERVNNRELLSSPLLLTLDTGSYMARDYKTSAS